MEILSWTLFALAIFIRTRQKKGVRPYLPLVNHFVLLNICVFIGLVLNPALKDFWFQMGFMRWGFVLYGLYICLF